MGKTILPLGNIPGTEKKALKKKNAPLDRKYIMNNLPNPGLWKPITEQILWHLSTFSNATELVKIISSITGY